jgi:hypothetical protein
MLGLMNANDLDKMRFNAFYLLLVIVIHIEFTLILE